LEKVSLSLVTCFIALYLIAQTRGKQRLHWALAIPSDWPRKKGNLEEKKGRKYQKVFTIVARSHKGDEEHAEFMPSFSSPVTIIIYMAHTQIAHRKRSITAWRLRHEP
jgi:hypothetical protein